MPPDNRHPGELSDGQPSPVGDPGLYLRILENIDRAVIACDQSGVIMLFNPAAEALLERSCRQAIGRDYRKLFEGQDRLLYLVRLALESGRSVTDDEGIDLERHNPPPVPVNVYVAPIFTDRGTQDGAVLILRDMTHIRELEGTLRRTDRLSLLGTLAAGLAHEIKNPLGGIKGAAQLLAMELSGDERVEEYSQVMVREVERINAIIEELMDLGNPRPPEIGEVDLARILGDIVLLQQEAARGQGITFNLKLDPSIPPMQADAHLLTRLFLNLVKNAREAIGGPGEVTVETRISPSYHLTGSNHRTSPMVDIRISDSGCGIAAEELERIFTPYFTTKTGGSGLGLATCQKVIEDHNGLLKVESTPGQGTTMTVSLPLRR